MNNFCDINDICNSGEQFSVSINFYEDIVLFIGIQMEESFVFYDRNCEDSSEIIFHQGENYCKF